MQGRELRALLVRVDSRSKTHNGRAYGVKCAKPVRERRFIDYSAEI